MSDITNPRVKSSNTRHAKRRAAVQAYLIRAGVCGALALTLTGCNTVWNQAGHHQGSEKDFNFGYKPSGGGGNGEHATEKNPWNTHASATAPSATTDQSVRVDDVQAPSTPETPKSKATPQPQPQPRAQRARGPESQPPAVVTPKAPAGAETTPTDHSTDVLPRYSGVHLERYGNVRWLAVHAPADWVWSHCRRFLHRAGLHIDRTEPKAGFLETAWATRVPDIPLNTINKIFQAGTAGDMAYRFRLRLERDPNRAGTVDVYLNEQVARRVADAEDAHLGQSGGSLWRPVASQPHMEALMLSRLMVALGKSRDAAQSAVHDTSSRTPDIRLGRSSDGAAYLLMDAQLTDAWRATQTALDRIALSIRPQPDVARFQVRTAAGQHFTVSLHSQGDRTRVHIQAVSAADRAAANTLAQQLRRTLT